MFKHEDERRTIIDWANGDFKSCKVLIAKGGCSVGDHHHLHKDEQFLLLAGHATYVVIGNKEWRDVPAPCVWEVLRRNYHRFDLAEGSVLVGVATAAYDPADETKGHPNG